MAIHHGQSLVGYSPWGRKESDTTERLHIHVSLKDANCSQSFHHLVRPGGGDIWKLFGP